MSALVILVAAIALASGAAASEERWAVAAFSPAWSSDGRLAWTQQTPGTPYFHYDVVVVQLNGARRRVLIHDAVDPSWSPDGRRILYFQVAATNGGLWIANADGTSRRQVAPKAASAAWSSDGGTIYFNDGYSLCNEITAVRTNDLADRRVVANGYGPHPSPDGKRLAFLVDIDGSCAGGRGVLAIADADGSSVRVVNETETFSATWAPDGRTLAVVEGPRLAYQIALVAVDGSSRRVIGPGHAPAWSPDGRTLAFLTEARPGLAFPRDRPQLALYDVQRGLIRSNLLSASASGATGPAWSPDSRWIALGRAIERGEDDEVNPTVAAYVVMEIAPVHNVRAARRVSIAPCELRTPRCTLAGSPTADALRGAHGRDVIWGYGGNDRIDGARGNDELHGGSGTDVLSGGPGRDLVTGGADDDVFLVRDGEKDTVYCGPGYDVVIADVVDAVSRTCERVIRN
jgi:Tol biopolymer transport system component